MRTRKYTYFTPIKKINEYFKSTNNIQIEEDGISQFRDKEKYLYNTAYNVDFTSEVESYSLANECSYIYNYETPEINNQNNKPLYTWIEYDVENQGNEPQIWNFHRTIII